MIVTGRLGQVCDEAADGSSSNNGRRKNGIANASHEICLVSENCVP